MQSTAAREQGDVVLEPQLRIHLPPCSPVRLFAGSPWQAPGFLYSIFSGCPSEFLGSFGFVHTVTDAFLCVWDDYVNRNGERPSGSEIASLFF